MGQSLKEQYASLPYDKQKAWLDSITDEEAAALLASWEWEARPEQQPPEGYRTWLILAGRRFGKTRAAAEECINLVKQGYKRGAVVAQAAKETRETCIEGESGLLAIAEMRGVRAEYKSSVPKIIFPDYKAEIIAYTADQPRQLRGPGHDFAWADEIAAWTQAEYALSMLRMTMSVKGKREPKLILTTTPQNTPLIRREATSSLVHVTGGPTWENASNLADSYIEEMHERYDGTRLGRQEMLGEILDDVVGAYWNTEMLLHGERLDAYERVVLAVDPATTVGEKSDFTAITVVGKITKDGVPIYHVLHSEQMKVSPNAWAQRVNDLFHEFGVDRIVAETNQGGMMVESTMRNVNADLPITTIHAKTGKKLRAEPVVALYEQQRVIHVCDAADLEEQMCLFPTPAAEHDDLVDSLVYAISELSNIKPIKPPSRIHSFATIG